MRLLFKICAEAEWRAAAHRGVFDGAAIDLADGFIHLSAADQVRETAARHFAGRGGLVLVAFSDSALEGLRWEPSRGGALFPHVYGTIPTAAALWVKPLPWRDGSHRFPADVRG